MSNVTWQEDNDWAEKVRATRPITYKDNMMYDRLKNVKMPITSESIKHFTTDQLIALRYVASMEKLDGLYRIYRNENERRLRLLEDILNEVGRRN